jgi:hypothetical protein
MNPQLAQDAMQERKKLDAEDLINGKPSVSLD